jgi:5'-deoxynucleotidase YfbR-like HD superfamily hydrolase
MTKKEEAREQARGIRALLYGPTWADKMMLEQKARGAQTIVMALIEERFGPVPEEIKSRVESIQSMDRLKRLLRKTTTAKSLKGLRLG